MFEAAVRGLHRLDSTFWTEEDVFDRMLVTVEVHEEPRIHAVMVEHLKRWIKSHGAIAAKTDGRVNLFSRRHKSFNHQYPHIVEALGELPDGAVVDGEVVALDESGRPNFNLLQNFRSEAQHIHYFIFDLPVCQDRDLTRLPLSDRRKLMKSVVKLRSSHVRIAEQFKASANDMIAAVRQQQLEGVVGKRRDSMYEPGKRSGPAVNLAVSHPWAGRLPLGTIPLVCRLRHFARMKVISNQTLMFWLGATAFLNAPVATTAWPTKPSQLCAREVINEHLHLTSRISLAASKPMSSFTSARGSTVIGVRQP